MLLLNDELRCLNQRKLDEEEAFENFNQTDLNKDGVITWDEYLNVTFHTDKEKLANLELMHPVESVPLKQVYSV